MVSSQCTAFAVLLVLGLISVCHGAPVNPEPHIPEVKEGTDPMDDNFLQLEYKKYLEEVVQVLEADDGFKAELDKMGDDGQKDLANGQIAHYLQFANKNTRTKLDEIKRIEVRRLRDLHKKLMRETAEDIRAGKRHPQDLPKVDTDHVDHSNPHSFEIDDLKKLIKKTTDDLANLDKKRKDEFKRYEMNKEHEYRQELKHAKDKEEEERLRKEHEESQKRHKEHPKMNHPGNKEQLEEVWNEEDDMKNTEFDPKAFFMLHDIDGDGFLNVPEIEALFQTELDKVYNSSNPDDDMVERDEEMNRMREHVFGEIDADMDGLVSFDEFISSTKMEDFEKEDDWEQGLDDGDAYDVKEFDEFERALEEEEARFQEKHPTPGDAPHAGQQ